jgi:hypothetical protein
MLFPMSSTVFGLAHARGARVVVGVRVPLFGPLVITRLQARG